MSDLMRGETIIRDFMHWAEYAPEGPRANAAEALAKAWLHSTRMSDNERRHAQTALTALLDDPSPLVRMALAKVLCASNKVPLHLVRSLAADHPDIAAVVLKASPLFDETELIELLAHPSEKIAVAIASRRAISAGLSAAIAEISPEQGVLTLLDNAGAKLVGVSLERIAERFAQSAAIRDKLLRLQELPVSLRHELLCRHAQHLQAQATDREPMNDREAAEFLSEASDKIALRLASRAEDDLLEELTEHLRRCGGLNTRLMLRSLCSGRLRLFSHILARLTDIPLERVRKALMGARPATLRAMLRRAGLPVRVYQVFITAIEIVRLAEIGFEFDLDSEPARLLTDALLGEMQDEAYGENADILSFLRRFATDGARQEARAQIRQARNAPLTAA